jgi:peptidoglycan-N-acetylglucosamine deacetylase
MTPTDKTDGTMPTGLFCTVDVDSLYLYLGLYGHRSSEDQKLVATTYQLAVRRFAELFREFSLPATFFAVGKDLAYPEAVEVAQELVAQGHHIGNHSMNHRYDLIRLERAEAREEIAGGHEAISSAVGKAPRVFRAPGYNMTRREEHLLAELGYRYDASPLPSYPYLAIKYGVLGWLAMRRRKSQSIWGSPSAFMGGREPFRRGPLTILPCAATPWLRLPIIGTSLSTAPAPLFDHFVSSLSAMPFVGLEFHAVDLLELAGDGLPKALAAQKDLHVPLARKWERFRYLLKHLTRTHNPFVPE